jgi:hypothetical protein
VLHVQKGDKVRLRRGGPANARGVVDAVEGDRLIVRLDGHRTTVRVPESAVTNLSLAARKAWKTMPARNVGRPRGRRTDRVSVTLRIDRATWAWFQTYEDDGIIPDRSVVINAWFKRGLEKLARGER